MLPYDPVTAIQHLSAADPTLGALIHRAGPYGLELRPFDKSFEGLLRAIVYQQLSGKAAATIYGRIEALFGGRPSAQALLDLPDDKLRGAGMSRAKVAAANDLAAKCLDGTVPTPQAMASMTDDAIMERVTQVRGIGPWTVQMMLMFRLGRPDVLPTADLGIRKGFMFTYGLDDLPAPAEVAAYGERWRPYCTVASWYLWRAVDLE